MSVRPALCIVVHVNISSYHTHTRLCKHASGVPSDYISQAFKDGCSSLGFSDHCPYPDDSVWFGSRMSVAQVPEYISLVREAQETAPFPVRWGFECEWQPAFESWYRDFLKAECGAEYLVYGSHWVGVNGDFLYIPEAGESGLLHRYADLTVEALQTGLYDLFAHPDLFLAGFTTMTSDVKAVCEEIIDTAVEMKIPMEINGLGLQRPKIPGDSGMRSPYPVREFWEMAAERSAIIVCNSDAHRSEDVIVSCRNAYAFAREIGIEPVDTGTALGFIAADA